MASIARLSFIIHEMLAVKLDEVIVGRIIEVGFGRQPPAQTALDHMRCVNDDLKSGSTSCVKEGAGFMKTISAAIRKISG